MIGILARTLINAMEKRLGSNMDYLRALNAASPQAFDKFLKATALARHREAIPAAASHAAQLTAMAFEDCGPCLQIAINQARAAGLADAAIRAILSAAPAALPPDAALAYNFARAILARPAELDDTREAVRARWGEKGVVDLTMTVQGSRLFPMIKRGLGFAQSCQQVTIGTALAGVLPG